jgi:peptide-methionine (S)-S-oxide reductase
MKIFAALLFLSFSLARAETPKTEKAIFAGGCFWCIQQAFDALKPQGVISSKVGYSGGETKNPSYEEVSSGRSGHLESIEVVFDPAKISFEKLLDNYWENIDPLDAAGQFCDKGAQYQSAVFYFSKEQKIAFEKSKLAIQKKLKGKGIVATRLIPADKFYPAEDYHQSYYQKNPLQYGTYKYGCGRPSRLKELWGKSAKHE